MKKTFIILGVILAVLIVVGLIGGYLVQMKGSTLDKESKAFIDQVTPIILSQPQKETLFRYASDELKNSASSEQFDKTFSQFGKLGQFKEYKGSNGQARILATTGKRKQIAAFYDAEAEFATGPVAIRIVTIKKETGWQIVGFHINTIAPAN